LKKIILNSDTWTGIQSHMADELIRGALADPNSYHNKPLPDTVFHYTSLDGLIGIVESQSLYASNLYYLNDRKEYQHGIDLILEILPKLKTNPTWTSILAKVENNLDLFKKSERYVTCFSSNGDSLSQWRAYGYDGRGISIGFKREHIEDSCFSQHIHSSMILYDQSAQKYNLRKQISSILTYFDDIKNGIDWGDFDSDFLIAESLIGFLEKQIAIYKHPSFQDEEEYRLEYELDGNINKHDDEKLRFRSSSNNLIVPYIKLTCEYQEFLRNKEKEKMYEPNHMIKNLPIEQIIIGPSLEFSPLENSIKLLLTKSGYGEIPILASQVPYRI